MTERAWDAVDAVAQAITKRNYPESATVRFRPCEEPLLYGYIALGKNDEAWVDRTEQGLNRAIERAWGTGRYLGLYGGLAGLGWVVEHLSRMLVDPAQEEGAKDGELEEQVDLNADVDDAMLAELRRSRSWTGPYDLISGLVGMGVYFLERLPGVKAEEGIQLVLEHLEAISEVTAAGRAWHSGPDLLPEWQRELCPSGYYNLGVAHGIPGILHFLSEAAAAGIGAGRAGSMLEEGVDWLIAQQRAPGKLSRFSGWLAEGQDVDSRLTWCYGDLGILSVARQIVSRHSLPRWRRFADELLEHCLAWPIDRAGVADAPLCHGAMGTGHIFNRIYQAEGDERCRERALIFVDKALAMRVTDSGVGGFVAYTKPDRNGPVVWESTPAFLDGAIGIALGLLSVLTTVEPEWDRMLLTSGRSWDKVS
jgi:hypothetical protein